ncbi:hypothetical protein DL96DRAFT_1586672 [Flagelloscypha sp. PMI_526]|nr:hypothetical protein DL96DRAFT_1586672 [Flagelloscypha sp. PMI_526]
MKFSVVTFIATYLLATTASPIVALGTDVVGWPKREIDFNDWEKCKEAGEPEPWGQKARSQDGKVISNTNPWSRKKRSDDNISETNPWTLKKRNEDSISGTSTFKPFILMVLTVKGTDPWDKRHSGVEMTKREESNFDNLD